MGKRLKTILSTILCTTLIASIAGCSKTAGAPEKGRYVEERYESPKDVYIQTMTVLEDGKMAMVGGKMDGGLVYFTSQDEGKTWNENPVELPKEDGMETIPMNMNILNNGNILCSYFFMEPMPEIPVNEDKEAVTEDGEAVTEDIIKPEIDSTITEDMDFTEPEYKYALIYTDGKIEDIKIDLSNYEGDEKGYGGPQQIISAPNGDVFCTVADGSTIVQLDGSSFEEKNAYIFDDYINNFTIIGESLVVYGFESIVEFDINTGKEKGNLEKLEEKTIKAKSSYYPTFVNSGSKENIYYYDVTGLYAYNMKEKKVSKKIDGALSSFGNSDMYLMAFVEKSNDEYLAIFNDWSNNDIALINYHYDAEIASVPDNQIRVYSLLENDSIRQAVSAYTKEHPDTYVKYEVGLTFEDGVTEADALKTLNTEITAGNGPDIIILDGLNAEDYIQKGLLEDISDVISSYTDSDDIFKSMADAYTVDGKIYQFPTKFKVPMIIGKKDVISSVTDLNSLVELTKKLAKESEGRVFSDYYSPRGLVYSLYYLYGNKWLNDDNTINTDELSTFFTSTKEMYTAIDENFQKYIEKMNEKYPTEDGIDKDFVVDEEIDEEFDENLYPDKGEFDPEINNVYEMQYYLAPSVYADAFLMGEEIELMYGTIDGEYTYSSLITAVINNKDLDYKILSRGDEKIFIPSEVIGINAKGENKETAKEILKEMLSVKEKNRMMFGQGLTVNKTSLNNQFKLDEEYMPEFDKETNHYTTGSMIFEDENGTQKEIKQIWPNEEDINRLIGEIEGLEVAATVNKVLLVEVAKQFELFAAGDITLDDAMNTIVDNLDLYLSE